MGIKKWQSIKCQHVLESDLDGLPLVSGHRICVKSQGMGRESNGPNKEWDNKGMRLTVNIIFPESIGNSRLNWNINQIGCIIQRGILLIQEKCEFILDSPRRPGEASSWSNAVTFGPFLRVFRVSIRWCNPQSLASTHLLSGHPTRGGYTFCPWPNRWRHDAWRRKDILDGVSIKGRESSIGWLVLCSTKRIRWNRKK